MRATKDRTLHAVTSEGAVLYIRQSITRVKKDAHGKKTAELDTISPQIQENAGRAYCASRGYHVVAIVTDLNRTGRTLKRRKVQEAVGYIERGEAAVIVVWKWSRLARSRRDFAISCDAIESIGGRIESSTEPADTTTATGRLNRGILAEFAAFESDRVGEIIKEVHDSRVRQGLPANGRKRFGYRNIDKRFVVDPDTGPALAQAYRLYIAGTGYTGIARWFNDHGYRTTHDSFFRHGTVKLMLDSGFGAGLFLHRGELVQGVHEPVITMDEWVRYKETRERRSTMSSRAKASPFLLADLIKCGDCGGAMTARTVKGGHHWYRCHAKTERGCPNRYCKVPYVEAKVFEWLRNLVADVDAAARANRRRDAKRAAGERTAANLQRQILDKNKQLTQLTIDRASGLVPDDAYAAARDEIVAARSRLEAELADTEKRAATGPSFDIAEYAGLVNDWDLIPLQAKREALRRILVRVRVWAKPLVVTPVPVWEEEAVPRVT